MAKKSTSNQGAMGTLAVTYYEKYMLANLKTNTPFLRTWWGCACGKPGHHEVEVQKNDKRFKRRWERRTLTLCDGCKFKYDVMRAARRLPEFMKEYERQEKNCTVNVQERRPLTGKTVQMYTYKVKS